MIYQCIKCPKIKTGSPHRSSATKRWLCDECAHSQIDTNVKTKKTLEDKISLFKSIAHVVKR